MYRSSCRVLQVCREMLKLPEHDEANSNLGLYLNICLESCVHRSVCQMFSTKSYHFLRTRPRNSPRCPKMVINHRRCDDVTLVIASGFRSLDPLTSDIVASVAVSLINVGLFPIKWKKAKGFHVEFWWKPAAFSLHCIDLCQQQQVEREVLTNARDVTHLFTTPPFTIYLLATTAAATTGFPISLWMLLLLLLFFLTS